MSPECSHANNWVQAKFRNLSKLLGHLLWWIRSVSLNRLLEAINSINSYHFCIRCISSSFSVCFLFMAFCLKPSINVKWRSNADKLSQFEVIFSSDGFVWQQRSINVHYRKVLLWLWLILCGDFPVYELLAYSQTHCTVCCTLQYTHCTHVTPVSDPVARSLSGRRHRKVTTQHKPSSPDWWYLVSLNNRHCVKNPCSDIAADSRALQ